MKLNLIVETDESEERLDELRRVTDSRCPVYNTLKAAGIKVKSEWTKG
ncbi:OsmC family protein [Caldalkalibacillus thermarum TA2.A1]|uniref:OsmC family protein n=1 Tax=Caldalkalibacillus thermarum (strain TA2.A1) TaxID=986075 RepID=A0A8X8LCM1_CALTT|nr:OsmC family protein [Caldalkalibacillus thermarum]QZT35005.1 OsmC family protein [Caldalkalibacillus thermarum TA2.A1]